MRVFSFLKWILQKKIDDNLYIFNKNFQDIVNCEESVSDTYKAIVLLNFIPNTYKEVKNAIEYGRNILTPEIVINSLRIKEMEIRAEKYDKKSSGIHMMKGRTQFRQNNHDGYHSNGESSSNGGIKKGKGRSRSKFMTKVKKFYGCGNTGHFIKNYYK